MKTYQSFSMSGALRLFRREGGPRSAEGTEAGVCNVPVALHGTFQRLSAVLFLSFAASLAAYGSTVTCNNNSGDAALIQGALNSAGSGGTVTIAGTCSLGSTTLVPAGSVTINGSATLNYTGTGDALAYGGNNLTVTGLTFNGGGIEGTASHSQGGWTITNNTFQNISRASLSFAAVYIDNILTLGDNNKPNTISNNTFTNIWQNGFPNLPYSSDGTISGCHPHDQDCVGGSGIWWHGGLDNTTIDSNRFDKIGYNAIKGFMDLLYSSTPGWAFTAHNIQVTNNVMTNVFRIGIEVQGVGYNGCVGGCNTSLNPSDGTVVSGNYFYNPTVTYEAWPYSLLFGGTNAQYINNTGLGNVASCGFPAYGIEDGMKGGVTQGNVIATTCSGGFGAYISDSYGWSGYTDTYQNNIMCGVGQPHTPLDTNSTGATIVDRYEYRASTCPAGSNIASSNINVAFTSPNNQNVANGGNGTWNVAVISNLSLRYVQFFLDGSTSPIATQALQDPNTNFSNDRKWLYHATINTSSLATGTHTITAKATDVSGATQSASQTFSGGAVGTPNIQLNPTSLSFGTQALNATSNAQAVTITNSGTAPLTLSNISLTGANASEFGQTSNCNGSLAVGASCTVNLTFSPSATGPASAALTVSNNAAGSPQSVALSGTAIASVSGGGSGTSTPPPSLPTNLPQGMVLWLANNAGVVSSGTGVSEWEDQSGNGNNAVQSNSANQPLVVCGNNGQSALRFDGKSAFLSIPSLPIDGAQGLSIFLVSSSTVDPGAGYGMYAALFWPETNSWGSTFFATYQTTSYFRFGTTQSNNGPEYQIPMSRTNSFGLGEWIHAGTTDSMWLNGQSAGSYTGKIASLAGIANNAYIGQGLNSTFYSGDISEILVYNRALSTSERQAIEQYLMTKYHL